MPQQINLYPERKFCIYSVRNRRRTKGELDAAVANFR